METGRLIATGVGRLSVEKSPARERETTFRAYWLLQRGSIKRQRVVVYTKRGSCRRHPIPSPPRLIMKKEEEEDEAAAFPRRRPAF